MEPSDRPPVVGGVALALCPLLCIGIPVLLTAGIGSGLALAIGGLVVGGVVLLGLALGVLLVFRRRRAGSCCEPAEQTQAPAGSRASAQIPATNSARP